MKLRLLITLLILAFAFNLVAQQTDIGNLEDKYDQTEDLDIKIKLMKELIQLYRNSGSFQGTYLFNDFTNKHLQELNPTQKAKTALIEAGFRYGRNEYATTLDRTYYARRLLSQDSAKYVHELFEIYNLSGLAKSELGEYDSADYYQNKSLILANKLDSDEYRKLTYVGLGTNYWYKSDYRAANEAYFNALDYSKLVGDSIAIAYINQYIGIMYEKLGEYSKAMANYQVTLKVYESKKLKNRLPNIYTNIGVLYQKVGDYEASLENNNRAFEIFKQWGDSLRMATSLLNIGAVNIDKGDYGKALKALLQAYEFQKDRQGNNGLQITLANIGLAYERLFKPIEAKKYYLEGLEVAKKFEDKREIIRGYHRMAGLLREEGKYGEALEFGLQSLELSEELNVKEALSTTNYILFTIYRAMQRFQLALEHYEVHVEIEKELYNESSKNELNNLRAKYEYNLQKKELENNKKEIEDLGKENAQLETRQVILLVVFLILLFLITLLIIYNRSRVKRVRLERDLSQERAENTELGKRHLTHEIEIKEIKLKAYTEQLIQKNEMIAEFKDKVDEYKERLSRANENELSGSAIRVEGRSGSSLSWDEFRLRFDEVHTGYTQRLVSKHPDLTSNEIDVSVLLKVNLSYKDISSVLGVSYEGVKKSIQRLYKKLDFENVDLLRAYLIKI
ncbi:tetratricopeptide repeat protein [Roseivirga misakiensis]|uniref:HTH luxR-type domain-containing protein n=1 Tax=Roseivirga misakiensis TaxID=1563681 RepID=A0A1E5T8C8_9BACT|nr:tetratricopeptide repeat protein [Roseivirga misakiensis]OEK07639.1 hypothetical protein BFP71_00005 [Roseivirga misakiensis]